MLKPVIISPFGFLEVEMEGVFWNALKLRQTHLGQPPEAFDAVDVGRAIDELVLRVIDAESDHTQYPQIRYNPANHPS